MSIKEGEFVLPGDVLKDLCTVKEVTLYGPGIQPHDEPNTLRVTRAGILRFTPPALYWVDGKQKRYFPEKGDLVVGIVVNKQTDGFEVDIGARESANLSVLAFEGATKKQKPDLQVGDAVYAKVLYAYREMEPELVCIDSYYKARNLGPLSSDGVIMNLNIGFVQRLLDIECPLLQNLGKKYVFEIAVGMNGKVWINAKTIKDTFLIMNTLLAAEHQSSDSIRLLCKQYS